MLCILSIRDRQFVCQSEIKKSEGGSERWGDNDCRAAFTFPPLLPLFPRRRFKICARTLSHRASVNNLSLHRSLRNVSPSRHRLQRTGARARNRNERRQKRRVNERARAHISGHPSQCWISWKRWFFFCCQRVSRPKSCEFVTSRVPQITEKSSGPHSLFLSPSPLLTLSLPLARHTPE